MSFSRTIIFLLKNRLSETLASHKSGRGVIMCHEPKTIPAVLVKSPATSAIRHYSCPLLFSTAQACPTGLLGIPFAKRIRHCNGSHCTINPQHFAVHQTGKVLPARNPCPADASPQPVSTSRAPHPILAALHCVLWGSEETLCSPKKDGEQMVKEEILVSLISQPPEERYSQL